jgi:hypothetical protein
VLIKGLYDRSDIYGGDLLQALELAIGFAESLLSGPHDSYEVVWPDGSPYGTTER